MSTDDDDISSLYRQAGKPTPSHKLDDAILAASRDAVKTKVAVCPKTLCPEIASLLGSIVAKISRCQDLMDPAIDAVCKAS